MAKRGDSMEEPPRRRNRWTSAQARIAGRKGGSAWRVDSRWRSDEYKAGYSAGHKAGQASATERTGPMRTLFDIVEAAKVGEPTTHDECLYALLAYAGLAHFDSSALRHLAFEPSKFRTPQREAEESHRRWKTALEKSPKDWLGPNNDPANPACQQRVQLARRIFDKVLAQQKGQAER